MQAYLMEEMFRRSSCDLTAKNQSLLVRFDQPRQELKIAGITAAALYRMPNRVIHMEIETDAASYRFVLHGEADRDAIALLYELTRQNARLELRTSEAL